MGFHIDIITDTIAGLTVVGAVVDAAPSVIAAALAVVVASLAVVVAAPVVTESNWKNNLNVVLTTVTTVVAGACLPDDQPWSWHFAGEVKRDKNIERKVFKVNAFLVQTCEYDPNVNIITDSNI